MVEKKEMDEFENEEDEEDLDLDDDEDIDKEIDEPPYDYHELD